ncbi:MAG: NAD(P)H-dependent oxidoreductase [Promethearchaeota archaeon]|nr:MAG: NAD(P)H-dependent oxidoreductase [Candidatus Lokiarchaeota archaeon]
MVKVLVVYYSLTGNTKMIAENIAESIDSDILELKPVKELDAESGMKYVWGGFQATMKQKPKLKEFDINPLDYELIILGTPVWAWTISPPIRSFLSKFKLSGKKVALWTCSGGDGVRAMKQFREALKDINIVGEIRFKEPKQYESDKAKEQARVWAKKLIEKL